MTRRNRRRNSYGRVDRRRYEKKRLVIRNRIIFGAMIVGVLLTIWLIAFLVVRGQVKKAGNTTIYNNVFIDQVDVSGMSKEEAKTALEASVKQQGTEELTLMLETEKMTVTLSELGFQIADMDELINRAFSYGKEGSVWKRHSQIRDLKDEKKVFTASYNIDADLTKEVLEKELEEVNKGTLDATITRKNGTFVITDEVQGITADMEASQSILKEYFTGDWRKKDKAIQLVSTVDEPKITRADLEHIQDVLGKFTTTCGTGGGRVQNIKTGAGKMNGTVLMPGEEFSADAAMRPYTKENGYEEAGSYENGKVVQSMGGGICQVSSTLYNAVLLAELEITQRSPHSMLVGYVDPAMDAAIAGDYKDLKFKNNTEYPVYIESYISGGKITFVIYGKDTRDANRKIKYESETLSTEEEDPKYETSNDALGKIKKIDSGHIATKAKLWKIIYENGKEVGKEVVNNSKYSGSPVIYSVGIKSDNKEAVKLVKDAVKTQDKAKIEAAISKAKDLIKKAEEGAVKAEDAETAE